MLNISNNFTNNFGALLVTNFYSWKYLNGRCDLSKREHLAFSDERPEEARNLQSEQVPKSHRVNLLDGMMERWKSEIS